MSSYIFSQIKANDTRAQKQLQELLTKAGIFMEQASDFTLGIFDEEYNLIATGSANNGELHSIAVDALHRGKGLLNQIMTHLHDWQFGLGNYSLYLKANPELVPVFRGMGFYELEMIGAEVYMGNRKLVSGGDMVMSA